MYYRITTYDFDPSQKESTFSWMESVMPRFKDLGALNIHFMEYGDNNGAIVACYPSEQLADVASDASKQTFGEAIGKGYIKPESIKQIAGPVTFDYLN